MRRRLPSWHTASETVEEYVLVAQDRMEVTVFGREQRWAAEVLTQPLESLALRSIGLSLTLQAVYEGVKV